VQSASPKSYSGLQDEDVGGALPRRAEAVPFVSRQQIDMESTIGIARAAVDMIRDGQVVMIDGGTTNLELLPTFQETKMS